MRSNPNCLNQSSIEPLKFGREGEAIMFGCAAISASDVYGEMMPSFEQVSSTLVGKAFERSVDGFINGEVLFVDA